MTRTFPGGVARVTPCEVWMLGCVPYEAAWALQQNLAKQPAAPDRLLILTHPHTYTLGTAADEQNLLWDDSERARRGVSLYRIDRGGDITYHGPGQLVGYPIIHLNRGTDLRLGVVDYLRKLESVIIAALADYGVVGKLIPALTGVWVDTPRGEEKIAAIGVRVTVKAITQHGFAINLNTDLAYFDGIIPCGIRDKGVTSLARLLDTPVDESAFARRLIHHFGVVFDMDVIETLPAGVITGQC